VIKINLVREGRAVRGAGAPAAGAGVPTGPAPANLNNLLVIGLAVVGLLIAGGYWLVTNRKLADKEEQVTSRKAEAQKLESVIKAVADFQRQKDNLQKRIDLINQLKQNQKGPVRIMDRISQDLPDLVWLDRMTIDQGRVTIAGRGLNPNAIANFIANVKNDAFFEEPSVGTVSKITDIPLVYGFDMDFAFSYAAKTPGGAPGGAATGSTGSATTTASGTAKK
jgi:Tfp pilus assembly protein PilN